MFYRENNRKKIVSFIPEYQIILYLLAVTLVVVQSLSRLNALTMRSVYIVISMDWKREGQTVGKGFYNSSKGSAVAREGAISIFLRIDLNIKEGVCLRFNFYHRTRDMSDRLSFEVDNACSLGILLELEITFDIKLSRVMSWHLISPSRSLRRKPHIPRVFWKRVWMNLLWSPTAGCIWKCKNVHHSINIVLQL